MYVLTNFNLLFCILKQYFFTHILFQSIICTCTLWRYFMFPEKIKITDDLIQLIVDTRKENNLTAYQLSEQIGKNKSWLPNIENHRTKNISNQDLLLIFKDFATREHLSTEYYIIKHLNPNAKVQLATGEIIPCRLLQKKYELLSPNISTEEFLDDLHFDRVDRPYIESIEELHKATEKLGTDLEKEFIYVDNAKVRNAIFDTIENLKGNIKANYQLANLFFSIDIFKNYPAEIDTKFEEDYITDAYSIIESTTKQFALLNAKTKVYGYFTEGGNNLYLNHQLAMQDNISYDTLSCLLDEIEYYIHAIYDYATLSFESKKNSTENFHRIYSIADRFLQGFIKASHIPYIINFTAPSKDATFDEIKESQLNLNNIFFEIKQIFLSRDTRYKATRD